MQQPVEGRQQRRPPRERLAQEGRIDPPGALDALDHGRLAGLTTQHHELEQLGDVAVVGPPGRRPRHLAGVGKLARRQRARGAEPFPDVEATGVVGPDPVAVGRPPPGGVPAPGRLPAGHVGAVERQVLAGPGHRPQLEQGPVGQGGAQLGRRVRRPEAAPGHEVGAQGDGGDREQRQGAPHPAARPGAGCPAAGPGRRYGARRAGRAGGRSRPPRRRGRRRCGGGGRRPGG